MNVKWRLIDDLCAGTQAMRDRGVEWLPRETKENVRDWESRRDRSILYSALSDTIDKTAARPFSKPVSLQEEDRLPESLQGIRDDADLAGSSLTEFGRSVFIDGLKYGKAHILVDFPPIGRTLRLSEERAFRVRPYFCRICPTDLIAWQSERGNNGVEFLTQVRIKETRIEPEGDYGEQEVEYVRVYTPEGWSLQRKADSGTDWVVQEDGSQSLGKVPLVTIYFDRAGFMESNPSFEDLSWLNLAHWQSYSDQRNLLRVARVPILSATGLNKDEFGQGLTVGPSNLLKSTNPDAKFGYVEHSGAALGAGAEDIRALEERMEVLGLQPLISRSGGVTATAKSMDEARSESNIQAWIRSTEHGLWGAYELAAEWIGSELDEEFSVDIYSDFGLTMKSKDDMDTLSSMYAQGIITAETLLYEAKRRGVVNEMVDVDEEVQAARDAAPAGLLTMPTDEPDSDDDETEDGEADAA
jgi:hypothetical protein